MTVIGIPGAIGLHLVRGDKAMSNIIEKTNVLEQILVQIICVFPLPDTQDAPALLGMLDSAFLFAYAVAMFFRWIS